MSALICRMPPEHIRLVWVASFYDGPLSGLCRVRGKLQRFERLPDAHRYRVYDLTFMERVRWVLSWRLFEVFVGTHCSFPRGSVRAWWSPMLHRALARFYYRWIQERTVA